MQICIYTIYGMVKLHQIRQNVNVSTNLFVPIIANICKDVTTKKGNVQLFLCYKNTKHKTKPYS